MEAASKLWVQAGEVRCQLRGRHLLAMYAELGGSLESNTAQTAKLTAEKEPGALTVLSSLLWQAVSTPFFNVSPEATAELHWFFRLAASRKPTGISLTATSWPLCRILRTCKFACIRMLWYHIMILFKFGLLMIQLIRTRKTWTRLINWNKWHSNREQSVSVLPPWERQFVPWSWSFRVAA